MSTRRRDSDSPAYYCFAKILFCSTTTKTTRSISTLLTRLLHRCFQEHFIEVQQDLDRLMLCHIQSQRARRKGSVLWIGTYLWSRTPKCRLPRLYFSAVRSHPKVLCLLFILSNTLNGRLLSSSPKLLSST